MGCGFYFLLNDLLEFIPERRIPMILTKNIVGNLIVVLELVVKNLCDFI